MTHYITIKKIMSILFNGFIVAGVVVLMLVLYLKHFEKTGIFYPSRDVTTTPAAVGLSFEEVMIPSGGETINAWFLQGPALAPVILFCHGNGGNVGNRVPLLKLFHDAGFGIFIFDYRGYGKSSGESSEAGFYEDALSSYRYLIATRAVAPRRIILYGESIGSAVALDLASKVTVTAVVVQGGFSSAIDMGRVIFPWVPSWLLENLASVKFDAQKRAANLKVPKLFIHGSADTIIPLSLGRKLYEGAASPKEFFIIPGDHNDGPYVYQREFITRFTEFVATHCSSS